MKGNTALNGRYCFIWYYDKVYLRHCKGWRSSHNLPQCNTLGRLSVFWLWSLLQSQRCSMFIEPGLEWLWLESFQGGRRRSRRPALCSLGYNPSDKRAASVPRSSIGSRWENLARQLVFGFGTFISILHNIQTAPRSKSRQPFLTQARGYTPLSRYPLLSLHLHSHLPMRSHPPAPSPNARSLPRPSLVSCPLSLYHAQGFVNAASVRKAMARLTMS